MVSGCVGEKVLTPRSDTSGYVSRARGVSGLPSNQSARSKAFAQDSTLKFPCTAFVSRNPHFDPRRSELLRTRFDLVLPELRAHFAQIPPRNSARFAPIIFSRRFSMHPRPSLSVVPVPAHECIMSDVNPQNSRSSSHLLFEFSELVRRKECARKAIGGRDTQRQEANEAESHIGGFRCPSRNGCLREATKCTNPSADPGPQGITTAVTLPPCG